jgi:hypothetical protein
MITIDLREQMELLRDSWVKLAKEKMDAGHSIPLTFAILCTRDPQTHQQWNEPGAVLYIPTEDDEHGKNIAGTIVKAIAISGKALAAMHVADAWTVSSGPSDPRPGQPGFRMPSEHPNRRECISVFIEYHHMSVTQLQKHYYHRDGKTLVWDEIDTEEIPLKDHGGRLAVLPRVALNAEIEEYAQKVCVAACQSMEQL